jgi:hypothetical protein
MRLLTEHELVLDELVGAEHLHEGQRLVAGSGRPT